MSHQFVVPADEEWVDALGVEPEQAGDEPWIRRVSLDVGSAGTVDLVYDPPGRSIRFRWQVGGAVVLDVFREGATLLRVGSGQGRAFTRIEFEVDGLRGALQIELLPEIRVKDELLLS